MDDQWLSPTMISGGERGAMLSGALWKGVLRAAMLPKGSLDFYGQRDACGEIISPCKSVFAPAIYSFK